MVELHEEHNGQILWVKLTGRLVKSDYLSLVPAVDRLIHEHGPIRMLIEMHEFHGWTAGALWEDTKFAFRHYHGIERLAVIGQKWWQRGMVTFCKPFTAAAIRYFHEDQADQAKDWLEQGMAAVA